MHMIQKISLIVLLLIPISAAYASNERAERMAIVSNLVEALNYNRYEQFIKNGSPEWRKHMNRGNYQKLHQEMTNYIGHVVNWKQVSKKSRGKIETYTYKLTGDTERIGLFMLVQLYEYRGRLVVNNIFFSKR